MSIRHTIKGTLDADGWLTTGDVGYLTEDQRLVLTGREKDLIIRGGHNIDPAAIEDVANQFPACRSAPRSACPTSMPARFRRCSSWLRPASRVDLEALRRHLEANVHEPPARPRSVLLIDALPVTAVGKIFKPALRDLAIREKVRLEVESACGPGSEAVVETGLDDRRRIVVNVGVKGADAARLAALEESLKPLPQIYLVRALEA